MTSDIEFLVKLRDACQMIADAAEEQLEKIKPATVKYDSKDFDKLSWTMKEGTKSSYEQTTKETNQNSEVFQALQKILSEHQGFWQNSNYKIWFHQNDKDTIDRRKK